MDIKPDYVYACDWQNDGDIYINIITSSTTKEITGKAIWASSGNGHTIDLTLYSSQYEQYLPRMTLLCHKDALENSSLEEMFPELFI